MASASYASLVTTQTLPSAYMSTAQKHGVPPDILYAVAMVESQTRIGEGESRPWPWTLNNAGTPYRFQNAQQTVDAIEKLLASGKRNIDVGLMQVNLIYHGHRFHTYADAVNPEYNLSAAAQILKHEYKRCKNDWWCAVGNYHSYRTENAERYRKKVRYEWEAIQ